MDLSWILDKEWGLRGKKGTFSSRPLKKEGRRKPDHSLIYTTRKYKNSINLKRIWHQQYLFHWELLQISFRRGKSLRQAGRYVE